jgi:hypothetical protein
MTFKSCAALGVCQTRKSPCEGCDWRLAPGAIRGPFKRTRFIWLRRNWRVCVFVLCALLAWAAITAVVSFGLGYWGHKYG